MPDLRGLVNTLLSTVQFSRSVVSDSLRPHGQQHARPPCPSPTPGVHPKLMSVELVMPSNDLILCCPLLLPPSIFPSIRVFSNESALCIRWPKYWSFSLNISPSNEHSGLISFRRSFRLPFPQEPLKSHMFGSVSEREQDVLGEQEITTGMKESRCPPGDLSPSTEPAILG